MKRDRGQIFDEYFAGVYGARWPDLKLALVKDSAKHTLSNPFSTSLSNYQLDQASLLPVQQLDIQTGTRIADFCSSPGGKLIAMIFSLRGEAEWFANDLSPARVTRLRAVLHDCVPSELLGRVHVSRGDASRWGMRGTMEFDRILVDAPCSGERHMLAKPSELARWSPKGVKGLVVRQHALLCSALDCVRPGGRVVYSTCSINPLENDGVIDRLHKSREGRFQVLKVKPDIPTEETAHGWIVLPDRNAHGPIYSCALERTDG